MEAIIIAGLALFSAAVAWTVHRGSLETERTIRVAIEKGLVTDPAQIIALRNSARLSGARRLQLLGLGLAVLAAAILAVSLIMMTIAGAMPTPLFALVAFLLVLGVGQYLCGRWLLARQQEN